MNFPEEPKPPLLNRGVPGWVLFLVLLAGAGIYVWGQREKAQIDHELREHGLPTQEEAEFDAKLKASQDRIRRK